MTPTPDPTPPAGGAKTHSDDFALFGSALCATAADPSVEAANDRIARLSDYPFYIFTSAGDILSERTSTTIKGHTRSDGYVEVTLLNKNGRKEKLYVHRLICAAFHGQPEAPNYLACHINDIKNDNRSDNLYWGTNQSNSDDAKGNGLQALGNEVTGAKLNDDVVRAIRALATIKTHQHIADFIGVSQSCITNVMRGTHWGHVQDYAPLVAEKDAEIARLKTSNDLLWRDLDGGRRENAALKAEVKKLEKGAPINTNVRLFDLVRYMRAELHEADLITSSEYAWLAGGSPMANDPKGGSPSPRRLEDYDKMKATITDLRAQLEQAQTLAGLRHQELCDRDIQLATATADLDTLNHDWKEKCMEADTMRMHYENSQTELAQERARLDWLEKWLVSLARLTSPDMSGIRFSGQFFNPAKERGEAGPTWLRLQGQTIRQAIDAARAQEGKTP